MCHLSLVYSFLPSARSPDRADPRAMAPTLHLGGAIAASLLALGMTVWWLRAKRSDDDDDDGRDRWAVREDGSACSSAGNLTAAEACQAAKTKPQVPLWLDAAALEGQAERGAAEGMPKRMVEALRRKEKAVRARAIEESKALDDACFKAAREKQAAGVLPDWIEAAALHEQAACAAAEGVPERVVEELRREERAARARAEQAVGGAREEPATEAAAEKPAVTKQAREGGAPKVKPQLGAVLQLSKETGASRAEARAALVACANDYDAARASLLPELEEELAALPSKTEAGTPTEDFAPAAHFEGGRPGWIYQRGPRGLGYYRDAAARGYCPAPLVASG